MDLDELILQVNLFYENCEFELSFSNKPQED